MIDYDACIDELVKLAEAEDMVERKAAIASACLGKTAQYGEPYQRRVVTTSGPVKAFNRARTMTSMGAGAGAATGLIGGAKFAPGLWKVPAALGGAAVGGLGGAIGGALLGRRGLQRQTATSTYYPQSPPGASQ